MASDTLPSPSSSNAESQPDEPTNNIVPSFSFSGCGFLGVYHIGVAICLRDHTDVCHRKEILWAGASAGALVAATLLSEIDFGQMTRLMLKVAKTVRNKEAVDLAYILRHLLNRYLPQDVHLRLRNRLHVSMTRLNGLSNVMVTNFHSKDHLIDCLVASSFVPGFLGWIPPRIEAGDFLSSLKDVRHCSDPPYDWADCDGSDQGSDLRQCHSKNRKRHHVSNSSYDSDSIWGVCAYDSQEDNCLGVPGTNLPPSKTQKKPESYLKKMMHVCFSGLKNTSSIVRNIPGASYLMDQVAPGALDSLDDLVEAIIVEMLENKETVLDGGFSQNIPVFDPNTITICPFAGESDICPRDACSLDMNFELGGTSMHASEDNIFRLNHALNPMNPKLLLKLCEDGYNECLQYLHRNNLLSCKKHLMTRAIISSSACNIGHSVCSCPVCQDARPRIQRSLSCADCRQVEFRALSSVLPADVRREFDIAIEEYKHQKQEQHSYWHGLITALWWCAEKMYASSMKLVDLSQDFHLWLLRFWDSIACLGSLADVQISRKKELIKSALSSLLRFLRTSAQNRSKLMCTAPRGLSPIVT